MEKTVSFPEFLVNFPSKRAEKKTKNAPNYRRFETHSFCVDCRSTGMHRRHMVKMLIKFKDMPLKILAFFFGFRLKLQSKQFSDYKNFGHGHIRPCRSC